MKLIIKKIILLIALIIFSACSKDEDTPPKLQSTSINKILNLGASRVEGARPDYESYRYELWKDLKANNWTFDFIGTQNDNASYPEFNSERFDKDHEGRGGWTSGEILANLNQWLSETGAPDVVIFSSPGGNDALNGLPYAQAVSNINAIIDLLQANNENVIILIEQMAPGHSTMMTPELTTFFNQMQSEILSIASNKSTPSSQIVAIDMFTGFNDSYLADDVHYNSAGAEFIAERYYKVLENVLD